MTVHHALFFFFLLSLQVRGSRAVQALTHYGESGGNFSFQCPFLSSGTLKIFCRENCEGENLLIRTSDKTAQNGRYRTEYVQEASRTYSVLSVSISGLNQSDSGLYRCGLGDSSSSASYKDFRLVVVDALLDGNKDHHVYKEAGSSLTVACSFGSSGRTKSFCRGGPGEEGFLFQISGGRAEGGRYSLEYDEQPSGGVLLVTISQLTQSDSGRYRCKLDRTGSTSLYRDFHVTFRDAVDPSVSTPPTTVSIRSSSGSFTPSASSKTTNVTQDNTATSKGASNHSVLMFVGLTLLIIAILISVVLLVFCTKRRNKRHEGLRRRGTDGAMMENIVQENVSSQDSTYQSLSPAGRDQNQIYSTLTQPK
ncbi:polymeric immunoglobulin receptor-like [Fundulus heteroclitus]|uniref:polymeric immunoglobulin receptor-like n=1 Tax=Fundulus heteroclitus TaxID=8078 RepID=UPI00165B8AEE|nr:polymeric immunoglobulin receptor-like [Fundulus heteroclitus]